MNSFHINGTLCSDRIRHGARITQALAVDCSDHEQVDGVGTETFDGKLCSFDMICYRLPAVAHRLTAVQEKENVISHYLSVCFIFVPAIHPCYTNGRGFDVTVETNLNASMTKEETGDAPAIPGCQDKDTLFLVTSVT